MTATAFGKITFLVLLSGVLVTHSCAQKADSLSRQFTIKLEVRPRTEYTYNYTLPPNDSISPCFHNTQRNRLSMLFARKKWLVKSDLQDIHLWGDANKFSKVGSINFYQLFIESRFKSINFRIGRQGVLLDNGRIFSDAPWSQQGRAHEGIRIMKYTSHISNDFFFLFTRKYGSQFDATYSPVTAHRYKYLLVNHFSYNSNKAFSFNSINAVEFFEHANSGKTYARATAGGRVEIKNKQWYYTTNMYVQFGNTPQGKKLFAYYLQPEVRLSLKRSTWRLGAEILSGSNPRLAANQAGDFDVLYGVAWKFMGNMNVFTRFPNDVAGKGLINPYLFVSVPLSKKLSIRSDYHLFYNQYHLINANGHKENKYLGWENDISLKYIPIKNLEINYGFSFLPPSRSMKFLPKVQDENKIAIWSYLMVSYSLNLLNVKR